MTLSLFPEEHTPIEVVIEALRQLRVNVVENEYALQKEIQYCFDNADISYEKEFQLGPRCRLDFLVNGGIVVEVKRGLNKPNQARVIRQLERYAAFESVNALILIVDRNLHLPSEINGKTCISLGLHKLWGIAL